LLRVSDWLKSFNCLLLLWSLRKVHWNVLIESNADHFKSISKCLRQFYFQKQETLSSISTFEHKFCSSLRLKCFCLQPCKLQDMLEFYFFISILNFLHTITTNNSSLMNNPFEEDKKHSFFKSPVISLSHLPNFNVFYFIFLSYWAKPS